MKIKFEISQDIYNHLVETKAKGGYACHIVDGARLGAVVNVKVTGTETVVQMRCSTVGGMFSGGSALVLHTPTPVEPTKV